jgi:hypothetical protein
MICPRCGEDSVTETAGLRVCVECRWTSVEQEQQRIFQLGRAAGLIGLLSDALIRDPASADLNRVLIERAVTFVEEINRTVKPKECRKCVEPES